jgi:HD-GYP domain-containing protein (c-di-GMP phosphodiesterase class II)
MDQLDELVGEAREQEGKPLAPRERIAVAISAMLMLLATFAISRWIPDDRSADPLLIAALILMFAGASRVEFEVGKVFAIPTQVVLVPMLFLVPLPIVPVMVALGYLIGELPELVRRQVHPDRWLLALSDAWFSLGPVVVLGLLATSDSPSTDDWWVYVLAQAAQAGVSLAYHMIMTTARGIGGARQSAKPVLYSEWIEAMLTPLAYVIAAAASDHAWLTLAVAPLLWLLYTFSKERAERLAAAIELHQTYRGTVMVLSDVVEADDNYTADHCRSVVDLAVATAEEMGLDHRMIQELETSALLHDVGKIAIPKEILNKPAKLTDDEFELMKSHTIEGQALLDRVGGKLARVGEIVRSCHERWDGQGYPDGLRGEEIPLAARIVFCCDAYSAMTTDRPYRAATTPEAAIAELRANSGTQFEPRVVEAVCRVAAAEATRIEQPYADAVRAVLASNPALPQHQAV